METSVSQRPTLRLKGVIHLHLKRLHAGCLVRVAIFLVAVYQGIVLAGQRSRWQCDYGGCLPSSSPQRLLCLLLLLAVVIRECWIRAALPRKTVVPGCAQTVGCTAQRALESVRI